MILAGMTACVLIATFALVMFVREGIDGDPFRRVAWVLVLLNAAALYYVGRWLRERAE